MARIVNYWADETPFDKGPFVLCALNGLYRIEVEFKGWECPVLMDVSIYDLLRKETTCPVGFSLQEKVEPWVDWLNEQVRKGRIVLDGRVWVTR